MKKIIKIIIVILIVAALICCGLRLYGAAIVKADGNGSGRESATYENWSGNCVFFSDYHILYAYSVTRDRKVPIAFNIWGIADDIQVLGDEASYLTYDWKGELSKCLSMNVKKPFCSRSEYEDYYEGCITEEYTYMADCDRIFRVNKKTKESKEMLRGENDDKDFELIGVANGVLYAYEGEDNIMYAIDSEIEKNAKKYDMKGLYAPYVYAYDGHTYFIDYDTGYLFEIENMLEKKYQTYEVDKDEIISNYAACQMIIKGGKLFCSSPNSDIYVSDISREKYGKLVDMEKYMKKNEICHNVSWCDDYIVVSVKSEDGDYLRLFVFDYNGNLLRERIEKM